MVMFTCETLQFITSHYYIKVVFTYSVVEDTKMAETGYQYDDWKYITQNVFEIVFV